MKAESLRDVRAAVEMGDERLRSALERLEYAHQVLIRLEGATVLGPRLEEVYGQLRRLRVELAVCLKDRAIARA